jgi:hypothetical protein
MTGSAAPSLAVQSRRHPATGGKRRVVVEIPADSAEEGIQQVQPQSPPAQAVTRDLHKVIFAEDFIELESISLESDLLFDWMSRPVTPLDFTTPIDALSDFLEPGYADAFDATVWG